MVGDMLLTMAAVSKQQSAEAQTTDKEEAVLSGLPLAFCSLCKMDGLVSCSVPTIIVK
jgi:hypothetical protein